MSLTPENSKSRRQERLRQVEQCLSSDLTVEKRCRRPRDLAPGHVQLGAERAPEVAVEGAREEEGIGRLPSRCLR